MEVKLLEMLAAKSAEVVFTDERADGQRRELQRLGDILDITRQGNQSVFTTYYGQSTFCCIAGRSCRYSNRQK
jgi:hypothetical protein